VTGGLKSVVHLLLKGIQMDSIFQRVLFGASSPGAAIAVEPVLIAAPYAVTCSHATRFHGAWSHVGQHNGSDLSVKGWNHES
jgi:hypothetical protein